MRRKKQDFPGIRIQPFHPGGHPAGVDKLPRHLLAVHRFRHRILPVKVVEPRHRVLKARHQLETLHVLTDPSL